MKFVCVCGKLNWFFFTLIFICSHCNKKCIYLIKLVAKRKNTTSKLTTCRFSNVHFWSCENKTFGTTAWLEVLRKTGKFTWVWRINTIVWWIIDCKSHSYKKAYACSLTVSSQYPLFILTQFQTIFTVYRGINNDVSFNYLQYYF